MFTSSIIRKLIISITDILFIFPILLFIIIFMKQKFLFKKYLFVFFSWISTHWVYLIYLCFLFKFQFIWIGIIPQISIIFLSNCDVFGSFLKFIFINNLIIRLIIVQNSFQWVDNIIYAWSLRSFINNSMVHKTNQIQTVKQFFLLISEHLFNSSEKF